MPWSKRSQDATRNNISKRWNTTENDVPKNQPSADTAIRFLNSSIADKTEYIHDVPNFVIASIKEARIQTVLNVFIAHEIEYGSNKMRGV
ncbi:UNVERIFIED_CONTAM: hypothetical protein NCL1_50392 [Trichonephila clavipes]